MKVVDCSREAPQAPGHRGVEDSTNALNDPGASAPESDHSTLAIVTKSALAALVFYLVAHLLYLYLDRWSDLDVEVVTLPSFEELDRSVFAQRVQWSSNPAIVDSPWRQVYEATSFSDAIGIIERSNACSTPDAEAFLSRARYACGSLNFRRRQYSEAISDVGEGREAMPASWSILLSMYFQDRYCSGYEIQGKQQCIDVGGPVHDGFASREDEACYAEANRSFGMYFGDDEPSKSGLLYVEVSDRTISPELYLSSLRRIREHDRVGVLERNGLTEVMAPDEIGLARDASSMIAMCEIYGVCPPLGLMIMSECMPDRCPVDGDARTYFRGIKSTETLELYELWSEELVSRREMLVHAQADLE